MLHLDQLRTQKEATAFGEAGKSHGWANMAQCAAYVFLHGLVGAPRDTLLRLHQDEYIVHPHSQHEERDHLDDDKGGRDADVRKDPDRGRDRNQHDGYSAQSKCYLTLNLEGNKNCHVTKITP